MELRPPKYPAAPRNVGFTLPIKPHPQLGPGSPGLPQAHLCKKALAPRTCQRQKRNPESLKLTRSSTTAEAPKRGHPDKAVATHGMSSNKVSTGEAKASTKVVLAPRFLKMSPTDIEGSWLTSLNVYTECS